MQEEVCLAVALTNRYEMLAVRVPGGVVVPFWIMRNPGQPVSVTTNKVDFVVSVSRTDESDLCSVR